MALEDRISTNSDQQVYMHRQTSYNWSIKKSRNEQPRPAIRVDILTNRIVHYSNSLREL